MEPILCAKRHSGPERNRIEIVIDAIIRGEPFDRAKGDPLGVLLLKPKLLAM